MLWCSIQPHRPGKCGMVMRATAAGWREGAQAIDGDPPDDGAPFAVYGQIWGAERLCPPAVAQGRPFWQIDNGFVKPARGGAIGYYRFSYRGFSPVLLAEAPLARAAAVGAALKPWRRTGRHVLLALPGRSFGKAIGLDRQIDEWLARVEGEIRARTDRPIRIRPKVDAATTLEQDLADCWALVTHSSNVAVDAALAGVPVFVAPTSPAAAIGSLDLADLERPAMPEREQWLASLMCQQFTIEEMANGTAYDHLCRVRGQVDG